LANQLKGNPMRVYKNLNNKLSLERGKFELDRGHRLSKIIEMLLEVKTEEEAEEWLSKPCSCSECKVSGISSPRLDFVNSEYSYKHLSWIFHSRK